MEAWWDGSSGGSGEVEAEEGSEWGLWIGVEGGARVAVVEAVEVWREGRKYRMYGK